jgi:hypothetical protein
MTVIELFQQVVPTRLIQPCSVTSCYELVVIKVLTSRFVQTISDLLEQLVACLLALSTLLQDDNIEWIDIANTEYRYAAIRIPVFLTCLF